MKKTYFRENLLIHGLVLVIAVIILFIFTLGEVKQVNDECFEILEDELDRMSVGYTSLPKSLYSFYDSLWFGSGVFYNGSFSMYGDIQYKYGELSGKLDVEDFTIIGEYDGKSNKRIGVIRNDIHKGIIKGNDIHEGIIKVGGIYKGYIKEMDVLTDGFFVYSGTIKDSEEVIQINSHDAICGDLYAMKLESTENVKYYFETIDLPITEEAAAIHKKHFDSGQNENSDIRKGFFTFYYTYDQKVWKEKPTNVLEVRMTFVMHPLESVWRRNKEEYKKFILWFIIFEIAIGVFLRYIRKRESLDNGLAKVLTKTSALGLESSMKILNEKVSDWENAKETDRNEYANQVIAEVDHMDEKIKEILSFKNMNSKELHLEYECLNLYEFTKIVSEELCSFLKKENKEVTLCSDHPENCEVYADLKMMRIIIKNIIMEAADYVEKRKSIRIRIDRIDKYKVGFYIRCEGLQISNKEAKMKWNETYASEKNRKSNIGVSRDGFEVVAHLLKAHHAKFGCEPTTSGTKFWFEMNAAKI